MALIEWREEYSTGNSGVDYEHKQLIELINSVYEMLEDSSDKDAVISCLGNIYGSISSHFALEEKWMELNQYDHYIEHRNDHNRLLDDLGAITDEFEASQKFDPEVLQHRLNQWFLVHFKTHDSRLHQFETAKVLNKSQTGTDTNKPIATWLLVCCATIFAMIVLGGVTRLTGSGLSMVEWEPIMGILPPMGQAEWEQAFRLYQQYPEYKLKNFHMSVEDFKSIFWFEYAHRLLGRTIGIIFFIPFLFFLVKRKIEKSLQPKLLAMFILGGLQGLMGWYMVKSGLVNDPHVSQYRLTAHLGLAIIIYAYMFWVALDQLLPKNLAATGQETEKLLDHVSLITLLIFITILSGGFVAGTRAGFAFNTFPLMNGQLFPDGFFSLEPYWRNFFENIVTIQFNHRLLATVVFATILLLWFKARKLELHPAARTGIHILLAALTLQIALGISTLLMVVPVSLAAAHQAGAVLLLTAALYANHQLRR